LFYDLQTAVCGSNPRIILLTDFSIKIKGLLIRSCAYFANGVHKFDAQLELAAPPD
jgi:hypothetical protein